MTYNEFSLDRLDEIPYAAWMGQDDRFTSVVIVPMNDLHDSGFQLMTFLFCKDEEVICRSTGSADVLHIDGIGGYGNWRSSEKIPLQVDVKGWMIDCLPNGYLRLLATKAYIKNGGGISDYEVFGEIPERKERKRNND